MEPRCGIAEWNRTGVAQAAANLQSAYAQGGLTAVIVGAILGALVDQLRARGVL